MNEAFGLEEQASKGAWDDGTDHLARSKAPILAAFGAHIFFDDQEKHILGASSVVTAGLMLGLHGAERPVIPAG